MLPTTRSLRLAVLVALGAICTNATAETFAAENAQHDIDLVIALDISGSMESLIDSAKQRL